tara:strand:+ start:5055 stop:6302 length:1248 start_codon:yes stop_codon:yes gene_type:complete
MKIILDKFNTKNIMAAKLWIEDGSRADPIDKKGLHQIFCSTILRGCGPYDNNHFAEIVESAGAILNCDTYEDGMLISLKCIESDAYNLLQLIGWMITKPSLEIDQIELEKDLTIKAIERQKQSTYQQAFDGWRKMIYADGPYGHDPLGSINHIKSIHKDHICSLADSLKYRGKTLVIAGNYPNNIENYIEDSIAFREIKKNNKNKNIITSHSKDSEVLIKQKASICSRILNTQQVVLLLGKATVIYNNEDDIILRLISCYFGYGMSSLLFKVLREKYGVVYEAGIYHPIREYKTPFIMHASTTEEKAILTLNLLKECWQSVIETEISDEELELLKIKYGGQMAHSFQSISQKAEHKAHILGIGLTNSHDKETLIRLKSVSSKEIRDAANKYLKDPSLSVCSNKEIIQEIKNNWSN